MLDRDILEGITLTDYQNDFCQTFTPSSPTDALSLICQNKFKKKKFIWIFIDGLAYELGELVESYDPVEGGMAMLTELYQVKFADATEVVQYLIDTDWIPDVEYVYLYVE
jgi:hypothetical protein